MMVRATPQVENCLIWKDLKDFYAFTYSVLNSYERKDTTTSGGTQ